MYKAVFFDLDGTLVPCDTNDFIKGYFKLLVSYVHEQNLGINVTKIPENIMKAAYAVMDNDGTKTNMELFWEVYFKLAPMADDTKKAFMRACDRFYKTRFEEAKSLLSDKDTAIDEVMDLLDEAMLIKVLATSPIFPRSATEKRIAWIGYHYTDFDHVTTFENCIYCKPNVEYYQSLLDMFALKATDVLMVGNDLKDDVAPAAKLGMDTFLIDRFVLNDDGSYTGPRGDFKDLLHYLESHVQ